MIRDRIIHRILIIIFLYVPLSSFAQFWGDYPEPVELDEPSELMKAVTAGDIDLVKELIDDGADVNFRQRMTFEYDDSVSCRTAVWYAVNFNKPEITLILLENGALLQADYYDDYFDEGIYSGYLETYCPDENPGSAELPGAVEKGNTEITAIILEYENIGNPQLNFLIKYVIDYRNSVEMVKVLFEKKQELFPDAEDTYSYILLASGRRGSEHIKYFLTSIDTEEYFRKSGTEALEEAILNRDFDSFDLLYQAMTESEEPEKLKSDYNRLLEFAFENDQDVMYKNILLYAEEGWISQNTLNRHLIDSGGKNERITSWLLSTYAFHQKVLDTALISFCEFHNGSRIDEILEYGADPDRADLYGNTPLIISVRNNSSTNVKTLIEHGADLSIKNNYGMTAANYVTKNTSAALAELLYKYGGMVQKTSIKLIEYSDSLDEQTGPAQAFDNDPGTAWVTGNEVSGLGENFKVYFSSQIYLDEIRISTESEKYDLNTLKSAGIYLFSGDRGTNNLHNFAYVPAYECIKSDEYYSIQLDRPRAITALQFILHLVEPEGKTEYTGISGMNLLLADIEIIIDDKELPQKKDQLRLLTSGGYYLDEYRGHIYDNLSSSFLNSNTYKRIDIFENVYIGRSFYFVNEKDETVFMINTSSPIAVEKSGKDILFFANCDNGFGKSDFTITKLDSNQDHIFTYLYGGIKADRVYQVLPFPEGRFLITGITSPDYQKNNLFLLMTDSSGNILWQSEIDYEGNPGIPQAVKIDQNSFAVMLGEYLYIFDALGNLNFAEKPGNYEKIVRISEGVIKLFTAKERNISVFEYDTVNSRKSLYDYEFSELIPDFEFMRYDEISIVSVFSDENGTVYLGGSAFQYEWDDVIEQSFSLVIKDEKTDIQYENIPASGLTEVLITDPEFLPVRYFKQRLPYSLSGNPDEAIPYNRMVQCNGNNIQLHESPDPGSGVIELLSENAAVEVLEKSENSTITGGLEDYWYRVKTDSGKTGWIYGLYLGRDRVKAFIEKFMEYRE